MATDVTRMNQLVKSVEAVIDAEGLKRVNGKVASLRTVEYSRQVMRETCRRLTTLGFLLNDISGLKEKHIGALVRSWYDQGLTNKTMQNQLSRLRIFAGWIGKDEIVKAGGLAAYLPEVDAKTLKVKTYADESKSFSGRGVDLVDVYLRAKLEDPRLGGMMLMGIAFGFRKKEMLRIKPWKADCGHELRVDGSVAKNGRFRAIPIELGTDYGRFQRWALDEVKSFCKKSETLGWPELTYKGSENRYYYYLKKLGITKVDSGVSGHGLRAEFAENMALWGGLIPPSLGGSVHQMPRDERKAISKGVSNLLGHDSEHTISAYYSTFRPVTQTGGLGGRVGPILVVDHSHDIFATLHVSPTPIKGPNGFRILTESERKETNITVVVEIPEKENQEIGIAEFVVMYPALQAKVQGILKQVGLI